MAYRFKLDEGIQAGLRRIGAAQLDRAIAYLDGREQHGAEGTAIHEARKSMKRLRALLRLVRPGLGGETFRNENAYLRETAALLSHARDSEVLLATIVKLDACDIHAPHAKLKTLSAAIADNPSISTHATVSEARREARDRLSRTRKRWARLKLASDDFEAVRLGLERSLRRAEAALEHAYSKPSDEAFHEWRKGVQQHWRHMALLRQAWPEMAEARLGAARQLSELLGDDHDLHVLQTRLDEIAPRSLTAGDRRAIRKLAARRQSELRAHARPIGTRLFADGPRDLSHRFELYWRAAAELRALRDSESDGDDKVSTA